MGHGVIHDLNRPHIRIYVVFAVDSRVDFGFRGCFCDPAPAKFPINIPALCKKLSPTIPGDRLHVDNSGMRVAAPQGHRC